MIRKGTFYLFLAILIILIAPCLAMAKISVEPSTTSFNDCYNSEVGVDIVISELSNVYGFQFDMSYDPGILEINSYDITEGGFLSNNSQDQTFCWNQSLPQGTGLIDNIFCTRLGSGVVEGTGTLVHITFQIKDSISSYPATSSLVLSNVEVSDPEQNALDNSVVNSQVTITHCECTDEDVRSCTASNGCAGEQTCSYGSWGTCIAIENYCDTDCNGTADTCMAGECPVCECIGYESRDCTTPEGCLGREECIGGYWNGECEIIGYYCDSDCDGTSECVTSPCPECECVGSETSTCYTGLPSTRGVGICSDGIQTCSNGHWGLCVGETTPATETCDGILDEDCDNSIDEGCNCINGEEMTCGTNVGACEYGTQTCSGGAWGPCLGGIKPNNEICDRLDNDCDGRTDEDLGSTTCGLGICRHIINNCIDGKSQTCNPLEGASKEVCDGILDEDCDGSVDEGCECIDSEEMFCGSDVGVCEFGTQLCSEGSWLPCSGGVDPSDEGCDGLDNDCDGSVDEDFDELGNICSVGLGICENQGFFICSEEGLNTECNATPDTASEEVCDGILDEDCDGSIDENCSCIEDQTQACQDVNGCLGVQSCDAGRWTGCVSSQYFCDADCDGNSECVDQDCSPCECIEDWNCTDWSDCTEGSQTRTCTDLSECGTTEQKPAVSQSCSTPSNPDNGGGSGGGGRSSGGGGGFFTPPCEENWECNIWGLCNKDGLRRRTCEDANDCGTTDEKPKELETCLYTGGCDDGLRNGDEEGVDCGGRCNDDCVGEEESSLNIALQAESINAEILDNYLLEVVVENKGENEARNLELKINGWTTDSKKIKSLLPSESKKQEFMLSIPGDPFIDSVEIQIIKEGKLVTAKDVNVELTVPDYGVKLASDPDTGRIKEAIIVDNRDESAKEIQTEYVVNKGKETVFIDAGKSYKIAEGELFHRTDYLHLENLPRGEYEVESVFYENGEVVDRATSYVVLGGEEKADFSYIFYIILILIIIISVFIFFKSYKRGGK